MEAFYYKFISFSKGITHVLISNDATHLVNLHEGICICLKFQIAINLIIIL